MNKNSRLNLSASILIGVALLFLFVTTNYALPSYDSLFQSQLPPPAPTSNPNQIKSASGGQIYCGSVQSTTWLVIPAGFTSEWGAEFHCSAAVALKNWGTQTGMWDNQGFLIGIYPASAPIVKPVLWVQEIDPVRTQGICKQCLVGRYYRSADNTWVDLPTVYDTDRGRVNVDIGKQRLASGYPGYEDRVLVALFQINANATVQVRATSTPASTATAISPTSQPTPTRQPTGSSLTPAPTMLPLTPSPMVIGTPLEPTSSPTTASETSLPSPPATSAPASPTTMKLTTASTPAFAGSNASGPPSKVTLILVGMIGLLSVAVIALLILLIKKRPR